MLIESIANKYFVFCNTSQELWVDESTLNNNKKLDYTLISYLREPRYTCRIIVFTYGNRNRKYTLSISFAAREIQFALHRVMQIDLTCYAMVGKVGNYIWVINVWQVVNMKLNIS